MEISVGYGDDIAFNALCYGINYHPNTIQYLENSVSNISNTLTSAGNGFMSNAREIQNQFIGSDAMRLAKAAVAKASNLFQIDCIKSIWELSQLQNAPLTMQRWIAAEPSVRKRYQEQKCCCYNETYVDMFPGTIGDNHYDYRRVMDGVVTTDNDGLDLTVFYLDDLIEGDKELRLDEKSDIISTWEIVADLMKYGKDDPTDPWNDKL